MKYELNNRKDAVLLSYKFIGDILGRMSIIDMSMSLIISNHLTNNKTNKCMFLLNKVNFPPKVELFKSILIENGFLNKPDYPKIIEDITKMNALRNLFAHSLIRTPTVKDYSKLKHFTLQHFKKLEENSEVFTTEKYLIDSHDETINKFQNILNELNKMMPN